MKIKHKVYTRHIGSGEKPDNVYRGLIKHTAFMTLQFEDVGMPCVVGVLIADDPAIRAYNLRYREIDKATDVLSFPMQNFNAPGWQGIESVDFDRDTQTVPLGDIIISTPTIARNARRFGNSFEQETVRMMIHSTLHLLGYDHSDEMRSKEDVYLREMGYV